MRGKRTALAGLTAAVIAAACAQGAQAATTPICPGGTAAPVNQLDITVGGVPTYGIYSVPATAPKGIVVVGHGHGATARSESALVQDIAGREGVIAIAMDYHGTIDQTPTSGYGWRVKEGAADSIAAAQLLASTCKVTGPITAFGISMGGNTTGLAVAAKATRPGGGPLFDYWFDVSGVTNVPEIYADATAIALAPVGGISATGKQAKAEIEQEFGNPLLQIGNYLTGSPFLRASDMKASGLKGVVISHGVLDGEVTSDQSVQMAATLALAGIPTDITTSVFKSPGGSSGLTLDGDVLGLIPGYASPFAGHVQTVVQDAALSRLDDLYQRGIAPTGTKVTLTDGVLGTIPLLPPATS
jgi:acetyl esterase/lipase